MIGPPLWQRPHPGIVACAGRRRHCPPGLGGAASAPELDGPSGTSGLLQRRTVRPPRGAPEERRCRKDGIDQQIGIHRPGLEPLKAPSYRIGARSHRQERPLGDVLAHVAHKASLLPGAGTLVFGGRSAGLERVEMRRRVSQSAGETRRRRPVGRADAANPRSNKRRHRRRIGCASSPASPPCRTRRQTHLAGSSDGGIRSRPAPRRRHIARPN